MSEDFSAKKLNSNSEPNPWETNTTQPKYQPPSSYTGGQTQANPTPNLGWEANGLPQSTYRPIYPVPPVENSAPPNNVPFTPYPYGQPLSEEEAYRRAKKRADEKISFYNNLRSYITTNIVLWGIWLAILITTGARQGIWPVWVTVFWGIGLALHFFNVFGWPQKLDFMNERDRQRLIEEEMRRYRR
jgi:2TM domain